MVMIHIDIKPLSINEAWQGKRFKTNKYKSFEEELMWKLPNKTQLDADAQLKVSFVFGLSSKLSDIDNPIKSCMDVLQKKYNFNDRNVFELHVVKQITKKKQEFIKFNIEQIISQ